MNVFSFSMPDGLATVSHCRMAQPHEQWLSEPICFHTVLPHAAAQLRKPYPESDAERQADDGDEQQPTRQPQSSRWNHGWGSAVTTSASYSDSTEDDDDEVPDRYAVGGNDDSDDGDNGTDAHYDDHGRSTSTASKWDRTLNPDFIPPLDLMWTRSLVVDLHRDQLIAMRAVLTRCACPCGMPYSHDLLANESRPRPDSTERCEYCAKPAPHTTARQYARQGQTLPPDGNDTRLDNWEMKRERHSCAELRCSDMDHPTRGCSGDICVMLQLCTRDVDRHLRYHTPACQYVLSCTVAATDGGKVSVACAMNMYIYAYDKVCSYDLLHCNKTTK
jgi:hypothetical protein